MRLLKIGITILLVVALLISGCVVIPGVEGDLTSDLKAAQHKMDQLKAQLQEIRRQISANKSAKYSLLSQLSSLNDQMEEMQSEIESINSRIVSLQNTLAKTAAQIAEKEKQIDALSEQTNASINLLYHVSNMDVVWAGIAWAKEHRVPIILNAAPARPHAEAFRGIDYLVETNRKLNCGDGSVWLKSGLKKARDCASLRRV